MSEAQQNTGTQVERLQESLKHFVTERDYFEKLSNDYYDQMEELKKANEGLRKIIDSLGRIQYDMEEDYTILTNKYEKAQTALKQIESWTRNPKEYEPSLSSINHLAHYGME